MPLADMLVECDVEGEKKYGKTLADLRGEPPRPTIYELTQRIAELEEALDRDMETLAIAIYEACRQEAADSRRPIVPESWDERDSRFREQFFSTIRRICSPGYATTPEAEHDSWMRAYEEMGWTYGPVRDAVAKTHPDMVPFDDLPESERQKDAIFLACCSVARAALLGDAPKEGL